MLDNHKPHIAALPIVEFNDIKPNTNQKLAISIPIFHSSVDTNRLDFDADRIKNIHAKGAAWVALSLIHNTDLYDNNVPIYFHVEDKIYNIVVEFFQQFNIPAHMIRRTSAPKNDSQLDGVDFGKKFLCLFDDEIETDMWMIYDTDSFACKNNGKMEWYETLVSPEFKSKISAMQRSETICNAERFHEWVQCLSLATGTNYDHQTTDIPGLLQLEKKCFEKVDIKYDESIISPDPLKRTLITTQSMTIPMDHKIVDFLREHYLNCYNDEFLLSMWDMGSVDNAAIDFHDTVNMKFYDKVDVYMAENADEYLNGYICHIYPYKHIEPYPELDEYWDQFFQDLSSNFYKAKETESNVTTSASDFIDNINLDTDYRELDTHKPHISALPTVDFREIRNNENQKLAISIPIFYSSMDTNRLDFDADRIKDIHAKGAAWVALSLIHNTDLYDNNVPIYFHVEDKLHSTVLEVFKEFNIPEHMIRVMTLPHGENNIYDVNFGKKYMCLNDDIVPDVWLICDTDAFVCKSGEKLKFYDKFISEKLKNNPSAMSVWVHDYTPDSFNGWVHGTCMGAGIPFDINIKDITELRKIEKDCFEKSNLNYVFSLEDEAFPRVCTGTQFVSIPTNHKIVETIQDNYINCYQDEFLLAMWEMQDENNTIVNLENLLDIAFFPRLADYIDRNKRNDKHGYIMHVCPDKYEEGNTRIDEYWKEFFTLLASNYYQNKAITHSSDTAISKPKQKVSNVKTIPSKLTFHCLGIPYAPTNREFVCCAFVQKVRKFCEMMHSLGHTIIHYGHELSDVNCTEHVNVIDDIVLKRAYGSNNYSSVPDYSKDDLAFQIFHINAERELRKRVQKDDFVLPFFGWGHKQLCDNISDIGIHVVEPGIGYPDSFAAYRVFESTSKMYIERGKSSAVNMFRIDFPDSKEYDDFRPWDTLAESVPDWGATVIPNYFDPKDFEYREEKDNYFLYIGRIHECKGIEIAIKVCEHTNQKLIIAGPGDLYKIGVDIPSSVDFVGMADHDLRKTLMSEAKGIICPSLYIEPFLGVHIEAGFSGTPIITTNWGAPQEYCIHGKTGYKCQSFEQFIRAIENIDSINSSDCLENAMYFSMDNVSLMYHDYFQMISRHIYNKGDFFKIDDSYDFDIAHFNYEYDKSRVAERIAEIQVKIQKEIEA